MEMSDQVRALKENLEGKLKYLQSLDRLPQLFVTEHFYEIRNEIDYAAEQQLFAADEATTDAINDVRNQFIEVLTNHEKALLNKLVVERENVKAETHRSDDLKSRYQKLSERVESSFKSGALELNEYEDLYGELAIEILNETNALERSLLGGQTFIFFKGNIGVGILLHLCDDYFTKHEIECFKRHLKFEARYHSGNPLCAINQLIETSLNRELAIYVQRPFVITKNLLTIFCLQRFLDKAIKSDTKHLFVVRKDSLDSALKLEDWTNEDMKDHLEEEYDSLNGELSRKSIEALDTVECPFAYMTRTLNDLDLSRNKLQSLDSSLSSLVNLKVLNLGNNQLTSLSPEFFTTFKNLKNLRMINTFKTGINFKLDFLASLENLEFLLLTLPDAPIDLDIFKGLTKLSSLVLETSVKKDSNSKRPKLTAESFAKFSSMFKLTQMHFSGFDIDRLEEEMLSKFESLRDLRFEACLIKSVESKAFHHLSSSSYSVNLSNNQIGELSPDMFIKLDGLDMLYLNKNCVERLNETSFKGLDNLLSLYMDGNQVDDLPVGVFDNFTKLRTLSFSMNRIRHVRAGLFDKMENLEYLDLHSNPIDTIDTNAFAKLKRLGRLDLSDCKLKVLKNEILNGLTSLLNLTIQRNEIEALSLYDLQFGSINASILQEELHLVGAEMFASLRKLQFLDLSGNRLKKLDLSLFVNLIELRSLNLSDNQIEELCGPALLGTLMKIYSINLERNRIRYISIQAFASSARSLEKLVLAGNKLEDASFLEFSSLRYLDLKDNQLEMIINDRTFSNLASLYELELDGNKKINIQDGSLGNLVNLCKFTTCGDFDLASNFRNFHELIHLSIRKSDRSLIAELANANKTENARLLTSVTSVDLSLCSSVARDLDYLSCVFPLLSELTLRGASLTTVNASWFRGLVKLTKLDVAENVIESLDDSELFKSLQSLEIINLAGNKLHRLHSRIFRKLVNLRVLDLSKNPSLSQLDSGLFRDLVKLESINLSGNGITSLNLSKLFKNSHILKAIDLSNNQLDHQSINEASFEALKCQFELTALDVSKNRLSNATFIRDLSKLEVLNLSHNGIKSLYDENGFNLLGRLMSLKRLDLSINPLEDLKSETFEHLVWGLESLELPDFAGGEDNFTSLKKNAKLAVKSYALIHMELFE